MTLSLNIAVSTDRRHLNLSPKFLLGIPEAQPPHLRETLLCWSLGEGHPSHLGLKSMSGRAACVHNMGPLVLLLGCTELVLS